MDDAREPSWLLKVDPVEVVPSPVQNRHEYVKLEGENVVQKVLYEVDGTHPVWYEVRFGDTHTEMVSLDELLRLENGSQSLEHYKQNPHRSPPEESETTNSTMVHTRARPKKSARSPGFVGLEALQFSDEEDELSGAPAQTSTRRGPILRVMRGHSGVSDSHISIGSSEASESSEETSPERLNRRSSRRLTRANDDNDGLEDEEDDESSSVSESGLFVLQSDLGPKSRKRKRLGRPAGPRLVIRGLSYDRSSRTNARRSERSTRAQGNMEEVGVDEIYRSDSDREPRNAVTKVSGAREAFKNLPRDDPFRLRHCQQCDTCGDGSNAGSLIYCQGCTLSYHKQCIGHRTGREHLVTKVGEGEFVLQCRRCVNVVQRRDPTAPNQGKCQSCHEVGPSCVPFRERKTPLQEQREREENNGEDPIADVDPDLVDNVDHVLFRCTNCWRACHFHHLPPRNQLHMDIDNVDDDERAEQRLNEYSRDWRCVDCVQMPAKVSGIIAWRPADVETYRAGFTAEMMDEEEKEYLIKWDKLSYFRATWMPGPWVWGVTAPAMRKAFSKRENGPRMRTEDAVPEEYLRIDIVLDIRYTSIVDTHAEEVDKARIKEVDEALIKYKGLGYEDAVWEKVPTPEDGDRWTDFVTAYNDWVLGRYVHVPKAGPLKNRLEKARVQPFTQLEKKKQPENLIGGELMKYQLDGLNWLYYQWYSQRNGILADEMGLGKTIQVIAFLATLVQDHNCFPFLIVVPNSTCANWRREIKQWAPALRVVTYFGSAAARAMAFQYEMYPENSKDLKCHVVVTSYEAAADDNCRKFFKSVTWQGLIVDEGQRLKSDKSLLYNALNALKIPFRVLLTGKNNARELFNLIQFLDETKNAAALEEEYAEMNKETILKLHDLIRPFILRRTKAQVLTFLPPMAQIILPVSMSVLQKQTYMAILEKNPELLRALFSTNRTLKPQERANLSNILMQLRKCLCHPFVYNREIEERTDIAAVSHRNLVEASAKLQLLELLLPKLQERGHRVLIFSQFLDMLNIVEDFLDGLEMRYQRLDGTMGSLEKQKRIDEFNAPESPLFAFLLSTRAGGVGINLATADTVIILDPDFNPHQDIQALSRAHRIGQKKKVLCFQLMTRASVEEKIVQIGRKKMALDHVVVEQLDAEDMEDQDVESILRYGAAELFAENSGEQDIRYDQASVDKLLDRSQIENTKAGDDNSAESQFSFARIWANDQGALEDSLNTAEEEQAPDPTVWDRILKERQKAAAAEAAARQQALGRGKRARMAVNYDTNERDAVETAADGIDGPGTSPTKPAGRSRKKASSDSDTDFMDTRSEAEESANELDGADPIEADELEDASAKAKKTPNGMAAPSDTKRPVLAPKPAPAGSAKPFVRATLPRPPPSSFTAAARWLCPACHTAHPVGSCPLKVAGPEHCPLCGLAHFGQGRTCPHFGSETQVREMLEALRKSTESKELVLLAAKYLRGLKGHIVQKKKRERESVDGGTGGGGVAVNGGGSGGGGGGGGGVGPPARAPVEERLVAALGRG